MISVTFLGTGTSHGIPVIGCHCPVCSSQDPYDKRWRASLLLEKEGTKVVIDTGYEFRLQALRAGIDKLDAVLYTHHHSDHLMGLDDLRVFTEKEKLKVYGLESTLERIEGIFPYAFSTMAYKGVPRLEPMPVRERETFTVGALSFTPIPLLHGQLRIAGYRFGKAAYFTDVSDMLWEENEEALKGIETLIIGGLRKVPHWSHFTFEQAAQAGERIGAKEIYFTHISHETSDGEIRRLYSGRALPAHDMLRLEVEE